MLEVEIAETIFETHVGGNIYDLGVDGSECHWARVLAFEPPDRVVFSCDISPQWQIETDLDKTSDGRGALHRRGAWPHARRARAPQPRPHGAGWEAERDGVGGDQGWPLYLDRFAQQLSA